MSERTASEQAQRYCRNCGAQARPGNMYCVSCGVQLAKETGNSKANFKRTDTTRYLSAAAYHDEGFRNQVIDHLVDERHTAIGPSYGVDLPTVTRHCLIANRLEVIRDISIVVLFLLMILVGISHRSFLFPSFILLSLLVVWPIIGFFEFWLSDSEIASNFSKSTFNPESSHFLFNRSLKKSLEDKLTNISGEQNGNVVIYSGHRFSPFVGSGFDAGGWSFTLRIDKGKEELAASLTPISFELEELYNHLANGIVEYGVDGLTIQDRLYVDGQEIRDDKRFLHDPFAQPYVQVEPSLIKSFINNPTQAVRYYKCINVINWKGEIVLSIFLRFAKVKNKLYAEANYFVLPPLKHKYHRVDAINPILTLREIIGIVMKSLIKAPLLLVFSPLFVARHINRVYRRWQQRRQIQKLIKMNLAFDYGAYISIRESAASSEYRRYFQRLDKEMNFKVLERQILDSIIEFLDSRNIDTSDLEDRQQWILNQGVVLSGGSIQAESVAVGKGAVSQISRLIRGGGGGDE